MFLKLDYIINIIIKTFIFITYKNKIDLTKKY